jgi:hypothetical protein
MGARRIATVDKDGFNRGGKNARGAQEKHDWRWNLHPSGRNHSKCYGPKVSARHQNKGQFHWHRQPLAHRGPDYTGDLVINE